MLYDLNIAWSPTTSSADLERTLKFSASLGYNTVALNHTIHPPITGPIVNPLPRIPPSPSSSSTQQPPQRSPLPAILHRATLTLSDPSTHHRLPQLAQAYDLLAVRPTTEKAFQAACVSIAEASLISLDLRARLPFYLRPKACMAAVKRGVRFEVCYAQVLSPNDAGSDPRARAAFLGNLVQLVRATRGRGLVVSSGGDGGGGGAEAVMALRAPADVVNLLAVWGLPADRAVEAMRANPRAVVVNEGIRRSGFRGVIDIVGVAEGRKEGGDETKQQGAVKKKGGQQQQQQRDGNDNNDGGNGGSKKRKSEEEGDQQQQQPPMSKRQAKKLRKAAVLREKQQAGAGEEKT
ncbi:RNase P subunit p30-domain-containing protein [Xylariaceae sp. FL0662B]|nr:RNase P subunit p30-domain-containing protein [Xylariaceae sp. FL0662B]